LIPEKHSLGKWGEEAACQFLEMCGYRCLDRRFRRPGGEIDLIMAKARMLVFLEVKTRGPRRRVPLAESVTRQQLIRLRRMARIWLAEHPGTVWHSYRFDVVLVAYGGDERGSEIRHLTGVC
jgi:putative endonuclease